MRIAAQLAALEAQRSRLSEQIGAQRALLASETQLRTNQQALFAQINDQTLDVDLWRRLDGLIGSAKCDKFRKFAQGLTMDHLLQLLLNCVDGVDTISAFGNAPANFQVVQALFYSFITGERPVGCLHLTQA